MNTVPLIRRLGFLASLHPALQLRCCTRRGEGVVNRCCIFAQHPVRIPVRLKTLNEGFHGYLYHVFATCALEGVERKRHDAFKAVFSVFYEHSFR